MNYEDQNWPDYVLTIIKERDPEVKPERGSLWVSRKNGRRGTCAWSTPSQVKLEFAQGHYTIIEMEDFDRLYQPV